MKEVFIIEKLDNHGEFQPICNYTFSSKSEALEFLIKLPEDNKKRRIMKYTRAENKS